ncbi:DUF6655 family protein [Dongia sp.]|uniref:DUF6655 family protein n=1 Tax=Dongia sp. TaxID=1977262 RepID=UPI003750BCBD
MYRSWTVCQTTLLATLLAVLLSACTTTRETEPQRTATEQLLISTAADRAADSIVLNLGPERRAFLDATNFEGFDGKYAIAAIRSSLLKKGTRMVAEKKDADTIIEIRSGALSIDKSETLVGIPSFDIPIPLAGDLGTPQVALYKSEEQQGVAKFAATAYDAKDGRFLGESAPPLGRSKIKRQVVLIVSWIEDDVHGKEAAPESKTTRGITFAP